MMGSKSSTFLSKYFVGELKIDSCFACRFGKKVYLCTWIIESSFFTYPSLSQVCWKTHFCLHVGETDRRNERNSKTKK